MSRRALSLVAVVVVVLALTGCPGPSEAEPLFPADYASRYLEVRDCRRSPEHELAYIRVLADPDAASVYTARTGTFAEGAVIVKEEFGDADCTDLVSFTAMRREDGEWRWQDLTTDRTVLEDGAIERCASCHARCEELPAGFEGTCAVP